MENDHSLPFAKNPICRAVGSDYSQIFVLSSRAGLSRSAGGGGRGHKSRARVLLAFSRGYRAPTTDICEPFRGSRHYRDINGPNPRAISVNSVETIAFKSRDIWRCIGV